MKKDKKVNPHRLILSDLSRDLDELRKIRVAKAETEEEAMILISLSINDLLMIHHKKESGAETFKTFHDWKKEGFKVKKGEKSYRIWGRPLKAKESKEIKNKESEEERTYKLFPMAALFNENQVEPIDPKTTHKPSEKTETNNEQLESVLSVDTEKATETAEVVESPFVCAGYNERVEDKKDRLEERAANARQQGQQLYSKAKDMASVIPFGQPILVGHHSEQRDRNYRNKIHNTFGKSFEMDSKADHLESRAASVGNSGIASDDPEALVKLEEKLKNLVKSQETMKAVNRALRSGNEEALKNSGLSESQIEEIKKPDFAGRVGFAPYALQNNNANINSTKKRIAELKALYEMEPIDFENEDFKIFVEDGRIRIDFAGGKPTKEVRQLLHKTYRFNFSRKTKEWVRKPTLAAMRSAKEASEALQKIESIY